MNEIEYFTFFEGDDTGLSNKPSEECLNKIQELKKIISENKTLDLLNFFLNIPEYTGIQLKSSREITVFNSVLKGEDFVCFNNGGEIPKPTIWSLSMCGGDIEKFKHFINKQGQYVYCFKLLGEEKILRSFPIDFEKHFLNVVDFSLKV